MIATPLMWPHFALTIHKVGSRNPIELKDHLIYCWTRGPNISQKPFTLVTYVYTFILSRILALEYCAFILLLFGHCSPMLHFFYTSIHLVPPFPSSWCCFEILQEHKGGRKRTWYSKKASKRVFKEAPSVYHRNNRNCCFVRVTSFPEESRALPITLGIHSAQIWSIDWYFSQLGSFLLPNEVGAVAPCTIMYFTIIFMFCTSHAKTISCMRWVSRLTGVCNIGVDDVVNWWL